MFDWAFRFVVYVVFYTPLIACSFFLGYFMASPHLHVHQASTDLAFITWCTMLTTKFYIELTAE